MVATIKVPTFVGIISLGERTLCLVIVAGNNKTYLSLHAQDPILLSDFNKIWNSYTRFHGNPLY